MLHWHASACLGLVLTGRYWPLCAAVYAAPDCRARRAFLLAMDRLFGERDHARRVWLTYEIGRAIQLSGPKV